MAVYHLSETVLQFSKDGFMLHAKQISTVPRENDRILQWRHAQMVHFQLSYFRKDGPTRLESLLCFFWCFRRLWRLFQYLDAAGGGNSGTSKVGSTGEV